MTHTAYIKDSPYILDKPPRDSRIEVSNIACEVESETGALTRNRKRNNQSKQANQVSKQCKQTNNKASKQRLTWQGKELQAFDLLIQRNLCSFQQLLHQKVNGWFTQKSSTRWERMHQKLFVPSKNHLLSASMDQVLPPFDTEVQSADRLTRARKSKELQGSQGERKEG